MLFRSYFAGEPMPTVNDKFIQFRLSFFLCAQLSIAATASERNRNRPDTATHGECQNRHTCRPFPFLYSAPVPCAGRLLFSGGKKAASFFRLSRIIFSGLHTIYATRCKSRPAVLHGAAYSLYAIFLIIHEFCAFVK